MKRIFASLIAFVLVTPGLCAEPAPVNIRVEVQIVAIPDELAWSLTNDFAKPEKVEPAYARIQELLKKGGAKLIGWPTVTTHSGNRAVVEAIHEIRYATEYDPPTVSFTPSVEMKKETIIEPRADVTLLEMIPTAFETRNVGVTLEVEPTLSADGKTIELNLVPQHVRLKGFNKITIEKPASGGKIVVEQPEFVTKKVTTSFHLRSGQRMLMGVYPTDEPPKHMEFFILKADVVPE